MINLNLSPATAKDLRDMLGVLRDENLFHLLTVQPVAATRTVATPEVKGKQGSHLTAIHDARRARLDELGLEQQPKPTDKERELQETINKERAEAGLPAINWRIDLVAREKALLEHGHDIYFNAPGATPEAQGTDFSGLIDLDNPVAT